MENSKKIEILFIHHGIGVGGAPNNLINIINGLDKNYFAAMVVLIKGGIAESLFRRNKIKFTVVNANNIYFLHTETGKINPLNLYKYFKVFYHWINGFLSAQKVLNDFKRFDIVHLGSHGLTNWAFAAKKLGFKVVLHNQETVSKGLFGLRRLILKSLISNSSDFVIDISFFNKIKLGIKSSEVIYNFIPIPAKVTVAFSEFNRPKLLYLGGQSSIKGFSTVVGCLPYLDKNIEVQFAGNYNKLNKPQTFKEKLKHWIKLNIYTKKYLPLQQLIEASNAKLLGLLIDPYPVIKACDILITPFKIEHFSRPAVEAFAYGKPVIGTDVEGMNEIIDHGVNGLLVEKNNPKALADAINYLCRQPEIAKKMGLKGREKAGKIFSPETNIKKVEDIYRKLIVDRDL